MTATTTPAVTSATTPATPAPTSTDTSVLDALKRKQHAVWSSGDYNKIAAITVPVAEHLVSAAAIRPGSQVLDVATGTGHAALAAARQFGRVSGVDYVPALVDVARRRAAAEDIEVDFVVGDAEELPFPAQSFDVVLSAIGVMFTADHQRAADELVRVVRPGGRIALASWSPSGFVGRLLATVGAHVSPPAGARPPTRWGDPQAVGELFGNQVSELRFEEAVVTQRFGSPEHFADYFLTYYGPTHKAAASLDVQARGALHADMVELARSHNRATDGSFVSDWAYLVAVGTRARRRG